MIAFSIGYESEIHILYEKEENITVGHIEMRTIPYMRMFKWWDLFCTYNVSSVIIDRHGKKCVVNEYTQSHTLNGKKGGNVQKIVLIASIIFIYSCYG